MSFRATETYDPDLFARLSEVEDRYFWFVARNRLIAALIARVAQKLQKGFRILEIGCGNGSVLRAIQNTCPQAIAFGTDLFVEGLRHAATRTRSPLIASDVHSSPFGQVFDLVGMFDVLEHLDDDLGVLRSISGLLVPDGRVVLTVPARQDLWSYSDEVAHHRRRYSADSLREVLERAGYEVQFISYFMLGTLPAVWLRRRVLTGKSTNSAQQNFLDELNVAPLTNSVLLRLVAWEAGWVGRGRRLPTGSSLVAIARLAKG